MELYISNNLIKDFKEIKKLKMLPKLIILDTSGNPMCKDSKKLDRIYAIYNLRKLKVLNGLSIETPELLEAKETFAGRLTEDILEHRLNGKSMGDIRELDLQQCKLRDFD